MRVLIIENEIYLAQSIAIKLSEFGFDCETVTLVDDALRKGEHDIILLSTNLIEQNIYPVIEQNKESVVILMASYVSEDTVSKPMKAGAKDYILKPFMIDELVRKIKHYSNFKYLSNIADFYRSYVDSTLKEFNTFIPSKITLPLVLRSQNQKSIDAYVIYYARKNNFSLSFFSLKEYDNWRSCLSKDSAKNKHITYVVGLEEFKKSERKEFLDMIMSRQIIVSYVGTDEVPFFNVVQVGGTNNIELGGEILCIDDYVKNIILQYEHKYPDTELSRRLGISRKSLWEKRKKYGIIKKK